MQIKEKPKVNQSAAVFINFQYIGLAILCSFLLAHNIIKYKIKSMIPLISIMFVGRRWEKK